MRPPPTIRNRCQDARGVDACGIWYYLYWHLSPEARDQGGEPIWVGTIIPFGASASPIAPFEVFDGAVSTGATGSYSATQHSWTTVAAFGGEGTATLELHPDPEGGGWNFDEGGASSWFDVLFELRSPHTFELSGWTSGDPGFQNNWGWYIASSHGMALRQADGTVIADGPGSGVLGPGVYGLSVWARVGNGASLLGGISAAYDFTFAVQDVSDFGSSRWLLIGAMSLLWMMRDMRRDGSGPDATAEQSGPVEVAATKARSA